VDGVDDFLLRHGATQVAEGAFDLSEVSDFLAKFHIANCDVHIAICNRRSQAMDLACFQQLAEDRTSLCWKSCALVATLCRTGPLQRAKTQPEFA
jgi:hypothetical protein